jgi:hypothetical protein
MAEIRFQILGNSNGRPGTNLDDLSGSGLAFFGSTAGSSVQIGNYQDTTYVSNGNATQFTDASSNIKFQKVSQYPSGRCVLEAVAGSAYETGLTGVRTMYGSLGIEFGHTSAVNVQNCQLRIYDRSNTSDPASGVVTKVAELVNHNGGTWDNQGADNGLSSAAQGSGDLWWWGEPWPSALTSQNYYTNSVGNIFRNGTDTDTVVNGDIRLRTLDVAGSYDTVGGTGVVVPLLDSPGSGQKQLQNSEVVSGSGMVWPKWTQYVPNGTNQNNIFGFSFGDGSSTTKTAGIAPIDRTFGGTGVDTHHTWSVALSASPLSSGSKEKYGLYVSLEYF